MRRTLLVLFSTCAIATGQDPAADVAVALLRKDPAAAARAAANAPTPALRARLQAALLPASERAPAMLAVACAFPADAEADRALVAGAAAVLVGGNRDGAVPELSVWTEVEGSRDSDPYSMAPVVIGLREALAARRAAGGDPALLQEAERLLSLACVTRFGLWPVRVPVGATLQRPPELREPLQLRLLPCEPGGLPWAKVDTLAGAVWSATLPVTGPVDLPAVPAGDWLLEARSPNTPWRGVRRVLASDLEAVALEQDGWLALAAFDPRGGAAAQWELWQDGAAVERGELGPGPALVDVRKPTIERPKPAELRLRGERGTAWLATASLTFGDPESARWLAHVMVDRPVFRPGETVLGRLVLRTCRWDGEGFARVPVTAPATGVAVAMVVHSRSAGPTKLPLQTDGNGLASFSFVVPAEALPGENLDFAVELPERNPDGEPLSLAAGSLCGVANFRRQAVQLAVEGPESALGDAAHVDVSVRAEWASGGPAAGLDVKAAINARDGWEREEAVALRTDAEGRATVRVPIASVGPRWVNVDFTVTGPDGKAVFERHSVVVVQPSDPDAEPEAAEWQQRDVPQIDLGEATVGAPCRITLRGKRGMPVLVVIGRSGNARVRTVTLGDDGQATIDEPVQRCDWPRFDVSVATVAGRSEEDVPVHLRTMREVTLDVPAKAPPGQDTTVRAHSDAPGALVTFAVVDERIYELAEDRTTDPEAALRPWLQHSGWANFDCPTSSTPVDLLASLLQHGRLPPLDWTRDLSRRGGSASGGMAGLAGGATVRTRFCPTAHFATVTADGNGDAAVTFRLPDDLTRWRVTAVVVGPDGMGAIARQAFASRQPLAAEPVLPRALRAGDRFELPLAIDRSADAAGPDAAVLTATGTGPVLAVDRARTELVVPAGRVVPTSVPMRAVAAGDATLQLAVELGAFADRSERAVAVAEDRVARSLTAAASGTGEVVVPLPTGASLDAAVTVDVLQGGAEAWRLLEADLASYPYGCAEQTLSRLLPRFALLRAAKARGETLPGLDVEFGKRLRMGLAHLRALQPDSSRQFAFWPGQEPEPGITALVLHGLAVLRDGGFDLAQSGLDLPDYYFRDALPRQDGVYVVDAPFVMATERLAGAVRLFPKDDYARRLLLPALDLLPKLPAGLCARIGIALHGAGDAASARVCRQRLQDAALPALAPDGFPGEDPLAVQALRLELDIALGAPPADVQRAAAELLLGCLSGHGTTYGRACALAALAMALPRTEAKLGTVVVEAGGERREFAIGGAAGAAVRCRLPHAAAITVRGPAGMPLLVRVATERSERASDHPAWAVPIRVERQWCTSRPDATWEERRDGRDLVPFAGPLLVGRPLVLRLVVTSPVPMRHVVVDCPLPAGFELPNEPEGIERFDDRVAFACDLAANAPRVLRIDVAPTVTGRFVWPPAVAEPMYCSGSDGGTAGAFVEVVAVPSGGVPSFAPCLQGPKPEVVEAPPDPLDDWCRVFEGAFEEDGEPDRDRLVDLFAGTGESWGKEPLWGVAGPDEATRARLVDALWAKLPPADAEPWRRLERLTELLAGLDVPREESMWPERAWRPGAHARVQALVVDCVVAAQHAPWPTERGAAYECTQRFSRALAYCPPTGVREALVAWWWPRAKEHDFAAGELLNLLPDVPRDRGLRAALREVAAAAKGEMFEHAWHLLGPDDRAALPPALVLDAAARDATGVIGWLADRDAGRAELRRRLASSEFVLAHFERLQAELPAALWADVPLVAFAGLATAAVEEELGVTVDAVVAHLVGGSFAVAELQQELAAAKVPAWRFLLASALRARGAEAGEAAPAAWAKALAVDATDVTGARALLAAEKAEKPGPDLAGELALLAEFLAPVFVGHATPDQLYEAREWLDTDRWRAAWARLPSPERVALLGHFQKRVGDQFVPATAAEAEALWQFVLRSGDVDGPVEAMTESDAGIVCLRRHLAAGEGGEHAQQIRELVADRLDIDRVTLEPNPGEEVRAVVRRLQRAGFAGAWSAADQDRLQRLRDWRGVGASAGR